MEKIDDLSYSGIVKIVKGEKTIGADVIYCCTNELEDINKQIKDAEIALKRLETRKRLLIEGAKNVVSHLKLNLPLTVQRDKFVVILNEDDLVINRNVI